MSIEIAEMYQLYRQALPLSTLIFYFIELVNLLKYFIYHALVLVERRSDLNRLRELSLKKFVCRDDTTFVGQKRRI